MNVSILFYSVLLIFNLPVRSEVPEQDSIIVRNDNLHSKANSKNTTIDSKNGIIGPSTKTLFTINEGVSLPKILHLQVTPGTMPKKSQNKMENAQKSGRTLNKLNAINIPVLVPLAQEQNRDYKPIIYLLNDKNKLNKTNDSENSILNTTNLTLRNSVTLNDEIKVTPTVETRIETEDEEESIRRSGPNNVTESNQHKKNHKHHHTYQHNHIKKEHEMIENLSDVSQSTTKVEAKDPIDTKIYKTISKDEDAKDEDLNESNFLNLHLKLSHVDVWNDINSKPTNDILMNEFSAETVVLDDSLTKFEDGELLKYHMNDIVKNYDINQENPQIIEDQSQSAIRSFKLIPRQNNIEPPKDKIFRGYHNNKRNGNYYRQHPHNQFEYQGSVNIRVKQIQPLIIPCRENTKNKKPYYECNIPNKYNRIIKDFYSNRGQLNPKEHNEVNKITNSNPENKINRQEYNFNRLKDRYTNYHFRENEDDLWKDILKEIKLVYNNEYNNWYDLLN